jgi:acetylornithine deacetylase
VDIDPIQLTRRLVDIESITYNEGAVGEYLADVLGSFKFQVEKMPVEAGRFNVYASSGTTPDVVLSTHMDTVPPFFGSSEDDEFIHGRGSCDAKGIIAAQIAAALRLRDSGVKAGLLFLVGEERDSAGAKVANTQPRGSRFLINGEPTDNRVAIAAKGALRAEIRAKGRMAHSAYPELGESAIHKLVEALDRVLALELPVVEGIGPATLNIGTIQGGRAPNVIADDASALVLVRLVGDSAGVRQQIVDAVGDLAKVTFTLEIPFMRFRAFDEMRGMETMVAAFTTDIPALTAWGEPVLLGPGSIHVAHTDRERLAKRELMEAVDLYERVATELVK